MVARVRRHGPDETRREVGRPICFESRGSRPKPKPTRTRGKRRQFRDSGEGGGAGETANASPAVRPAGGAAVREEMREGERDGVRGGDSPAATGARCPSSFYDVGFCGQSNTGQGVPVLEGVPGEELTVGVRMEEAEREPAIARDKLLIFQECFTG
uniref:Uncharacterized protein n=1 Tax=Oryza meridionalis TaxID=40149 RepID=A0A0E0DMJ3_9ORYZ